MHRDKAGWLAPVNKPWFELGILCETGLTAIHSVEIKGWVSRDVGVGECDGGGHDKLDALSRPACAFQAQYQELPQYALVAQTVLAQKS